MRKYFRGLRFKIFAALVLLFFVALVALTLIIRPLIAKYDIETSNTFQSEIAEQLASTLDKSLGRAVHELESIAALPEVVSMRKEKLDEAILMMEGANKFFSSYFVLDRQGRWVSFPSSPAMVGRKIPERNMDWVEETFDKDGTVFMDVVLTLNNMLVSGFSTPVRVSGGEAVGLMRGVIVISGENPVLSTIRDVRVGENGYAFVVSAGGWLITHPRMEITPENFDDYDFSGYLPVQRLMKGEKGMVEYEYEGRTWVAAYRPIKTTGWGLVVQQPKADIVEHVEGEFRIFAVISVAVFLVGVVVLSSAVGLVLRPLSRLVEGIRERKLPEAQAFPNDEVGQIAREFHLLYTDLMKSEDELRRHMDRLEEKVDQRTRSLKEANKRLRLEVAERMRAEEKTAASLREKEVLLKELHHRVKNNMQIIISLLRLQATLAGDKRYAELLGRCHDRIKSMSLVHERLYSSGGLSSIDLGGYVEQLVRGLRVSKSGSASDVEIETEIGDVALGIDTAIPCGMVINELVSNSLKHAFSEGENGRIDISIRPAGEGEFELVVTDNGCGLPEGFDFRNSGTLGFRLVLTLAEIQMDGSVTVESAGPGGGTTVRVRFREIAYSERI